MGACDETVERAAVSRFCEAFSAGSLSQWQWLISSAIELHNESHRSASQIIGLATVLRLAAPDMLLAPGIRLNLSFRCSD